jgi:hypothetical protein
MAGGATGTVGRPKRMLSEEDQASAVITTRGTKKWHAWVLRLADFRRLRATDLIDQALVEYADKHGFTEPAPKRSP